MKILESTEKYILFAITLLLPILVTSSFINPYATPKIILLGLGVILIFLIKAVKSILSGRLSYMGGSFDFPVLLLALAYILSAYFKTPNKPEAFFLPGTASFVILSALLYFIINQLKQNGKQHMGYVLSLASALVSILSLLSLAGVWKSIPQFPVFMQENSFSPLGGLLFSSIFLISILPLTIEYAFKERDMAKKALWGVVAVISLFGAIASGVQSISSNNQAQLPSFNTSWVVASDTLKESPLLGTGPGNYVSAFNRFRPLSYNSTEAWRVRFTSGRSILLTIMTEAGLLGMAGFLLILYPIYKSINLAIKEKKISGESTRNIVSLISLSLLLILILILPSNPVLIVLMFILLALASTTQSYDFTFGGGNHHNNSLGYRIPNIILAVPIILASAYVLFIGTKAVSAEYTYKKALEAVAKNDATNGYNLMQKAINTHPYVDRYRISYAQLNLALANAISQKKELNDQEKKNVTQLIQQSIREAKTAVILNRERSSNWELLAQIYKSVVPLAQNADVFAVQTLKQASILDPLNPDLRIALGGILFAGKNYSDAKDAFSLAVAVKPDLPNSHFNLAYAYKELGEYDRAISEMKAVMTLVDQNSKDYDTAKKALADFEAKKKTVTPVQGDSLTPPNTQPEKSDTQIELTEEETPPQAEEESATNSATPLP